MSAADAMLHNGSPKNYNPGCCNAMQLWNQTPTRPQGMAELPPGWLRGFGVGVATRVAGDWVSDPEFDNFWRLAHGGLGRAWDNWSLFGWPEQAKFAGGYQGSPTLELY